jgi:hypothetical protein
MGSGSMDQPRFVLEYEKIAISLIKQHALKEFNFSRGAYQVEVVEKKTSFFPFLQMSDEGRVSDAFCTCKLSEKGEGCPHLSAAYLRIFNATKEPLHVRFEKSLFNHLFLMASERHGYEVKCLKKESDGAYFATSKTKKRLFSIEALNKPSIQRLKKIVAERVVETEETSIKFSNLTPEEIQNWREGKASHSLRYYLSFWCDLAKWLMWLADDGQDYEIKLAAEPGQVPH